MTICDGCGGIFYIGVDSEMKIPSQSSQPLQAAEEGVYDGRKVWNIMSVARYVCRASSVEYLELCDKYFIGWTAEASSWQGAKHACRFAF